MLLKRRPPALESQSGAVAPSFDQLDEHAVAVLRWLNANRIEYVLVGPVAQAIRTSGPAGGPVAIVPEPYARNLQRLSRALWSAHARLRIDGESGSVPVKMNEEKLLRSERWTLRCGAHDLDIEGRPAGVPRYQELLYEAGKFELAPDLTVEVGSPEDIEHYYHLRRTGLPPEIRISRIAREENPTAP